MRAPPSSPTIATTDRGVWLVAAAVVVLHSVGAMVGPYSFFRDELYFIDCGRHPAFGYVDQPPLVPLLAATTQLFGHCLLLLRLLPALAHAATILVVARLADLVAAELGDSDERRRLVRLIAALLTAICPMYVGLHSTANTTMWEPLAWTLLAYAAARVVLGEARWLLWMGVVLGVALEAKYAAPFFVAPLLLGILLSRSRHLLWRWQSAAAVGIVALLALPSFAWQATHDFPFLELMHAASTGKNVVVAPLRFIGNQALVMNPTLALLAWVGVVWTLLSRRLGRFAFLAVAYLGVLVEMIALHGKDYYVAPAYGVAFALGAVAAPRLLRATASRVVYLVLVAVTTVIALPTSMPLLPPPLLTRFVVATHTAPQAQERSQLGSVIPPFLSDMLGWPELAERVADVWRELTPAERARTTIIANNYGEAGAINFYGAALGLPRAASGHNQYFLWGPGPQPDIILRINGQIEHWRGECDEVTVAARFGGPYLLPYEHDRAILKCVHPHSQLADIWDNFKNYN